MLCILLKSTLVFFFFVSDYPASKFSSDSEVISSPSSITKRKGGLMGLDPDSSFLYSPPKRQCKLQSPLRKTAPVDRSPPPCYMNLKPSWFYDLLNSPEVLSLSSVTDLGSEKAWTFEATCVDDQWRWNTCHRISIEPCKDSFLPDLGSFLLSEHQPPYQTVDVPMDGSCFFRYIPSLPPPFFFFFVGFLSFVFFSVRA